jgi:hypothetical protein
MNQKIKEDSYAIVDRHELNISALKKGLQTVDDLVNHFFEINHFTDGYLVYKRKLEVIVIPHQEEDMDR